MSWISKCLELINDQGDSINWFYDDTKTIDIYPFIEKVKNNTTVQIGHKEEDINFDLIMNRTTKTVVLISSNDDYNVGLIRGLIRGIYSKTAGGANSIGYHSMQSDVMRFGNIQVIVLATVKKPYSIQTYSSEYNMNDFKNGDNDIGR